MKPVSNISIGGYVFSVEEDACAKVTSYIDELDSFYSGKESGSEIMEGIEERMAELLLERCGGGRVVTMDAVEYVTATLGKPEAIEEESSIDDEPAVESADGRSQDAGSAADQPETAADNGNASETATSQESAKDSAIRKKLYRNPEAGKVAGVCSGLSIFFGVDVAIFRVVFVLLTLFGWSLHLGNLSNFSMPVIYLVLWICMPAAKTVSQKDEMKGERGTVDAISQRVQSGAKEIADTAADFGRSETGKNLIRIMAILLGTIFFIAGLCGTAASSAAVFGTSFLGRSSFLFNKLMEKSWNIDPTLLSMLYDNHVLIPLAFVVLIPFIALLYDGIRLIFNLKSPSWHPGLCLFVLWLVAIAVLAVMVIIRFPSFMSIVGI